MASKGTGVPGVGPFLLVQSGALHLLCTWPWGWWKVP